MYFCLRIATGQPADLKIDAKYHPFDQACTAMGCIGL
jgi:hypothetical protein